MAEDAVGKRITFDPATLERATSAAKERGMTLNRLVGLALEDFCGRLLPAEQIVWTRAEQTTWPAPTPAADPQDQ